ncbi:hypothetical protein PFISCL1PPCAC_8501, partial [Pristionchus fissidentatus]
IATLFFCIALIGAADVVAAPSTVAANDTTHSDPATTEHPVIQVIAVCVPVLSAVILALFILGYSIHKTRKDFNFRFWRIFCMVLSLLSAGVSTV